MHGTKPAAWASLALLATLTGCGGEPAAKPQTKTTPPIEKAAAKAEPKLDEHGHGHGAGPHGGPIIELGGGKFHGEFTVDHGKQRATVYILAEDAKAAWPVKAANGLISVKSPAFTADLKPAPLAGETADKCSAFVAVNDKFGKVQEFEGTVTFVIDGKPYSGDFKEEADHGHDKPGK